MMNTIQLAQLLDEAEVARQQRAYIEAVRLYDLILTQTSDIQTDAIVKEIKLAALREKRPFISAARQSSSSPQLL
ncbi:MAG: hypothetical protein M5U34_41480 [Chloroflexi bacterium]|nr:hypothetical protein [Chloroflexota bacterium]